MSGPDAVDLKTPSREPAAPILATSQPSDGNQPHPPHDPVPEMLKHDPDFRVIWEEVQHYGRMFGLTWRQFLDGWRSGTIADDSWEKSHYAMLAASVEQALVDCWNSSHDSTTSHEPLL